MSGLMFALITVLASPSGGELTVSNLGIPGQITAAAAGAADDSLLRELQIRPGEPDGPAGKTKRRKCLDAGGTWVTNSHGSFCFEKRETARQKMFEGNPLPPKLARLPTEGPEVQSWVWLERRRCVRGGGVFFEHANGSTFCMKMLDPA